MYLFVTFALFILICAFSPVIFLSNVQVKVVYAYLSILFVAGLALQLFAVHVFQTYDRLVVLDPYFIFEMRENTHTRLIEMLINSNLIPDLKNEISIILMNSAVYIVFGIVIIMAFQSKIINHIIDNKGNKVLLVGIYLIAILIAVITMIIHEPVAYDFVRFRFHFTWQQNPMYYMVYFDIRDTLITLSQIMVMLGVVDSIKKDFMKHSFVNL